MFVDQDDLLLHWSVGVLEGHDDDLVTFFDEPCCAAINANRTRPRISAHGVGLESCSIIHISHQDPFPRPNIRSL